MGLKPISVYPLLENYIANTFDVVFVVSDLTEMESLIMPFRKNNQALIAEFQEWFRRA